VGGIGESFRLAYVTMFPVVPLFRKFDSFGRIMKQKHIDMSVLGNVRHFVLGVVAFGIAF
jgi:hypothetical protein